MVRYYFYKMCYNGTFTIINELLNVTNLLVFGRQAEPTDAVIDSQSVKSTECSGISSYDAGKKIKGQKHQIIVDTQGNMLSAKFIAQAHKTVMVHPM